MPSAISDLETFSERNIYSGPTMYQILTSSWRVAIDPERYSLISISRSSPRGRRGYSVYRKLQPGAWFNSISDDRVWAELYVRKILAPLDPHVVVQEISELSDGRPAVLLCWEAADGPWCHRGLVSWWLKATINLEVPELDRESCGCGRDHPKLSPAARAMPLFS